MFFQFCHVLLLFFKLGREGREAANPNPKQVSSLGQWGGGWRGGGVLLLGDAAFSVVLFRSAVSSLLFLLVVLLLISPLGWCRFLPLTCGWWWCFSPCLPCGRCCLRGAGVVLLSPRVCCLPSPSSFWVLLRWLKTRFFSEKYE